MIKHWQHTELVSPYIYKEFLEHNTPIIPVDSLPCNTAVYIQSISGSKRLEGIYDPKLKGIRKLKGKGAPNRDLKLYLDALCNEDITMIAVDGLMGTGKTSTCIDDVCSRYFSKIKISDKEDKDGDSKPNVDIPKVVIAKPHINSGGSTEQYGFLPGGIDEKLDPTLRNFIQYFDRFNAYGFNKLREEGYISLLPLGFVRGLDAKNMILIVDEAQNTKELISVATRKASGTKVIFLGDTSPFQIDLRGNTPRDNGLNDIMELLQGAPYFQYIEMKTLEHIVRSDEVKDIIKRLFKKYGQDPQEWILN